MKRCLHWLETHPQTVAILFFACYFLVGAFIFKDYGVSWDEPGSIKTGEIAYQYVVNGTPYPEDFHNRSYGTAFDLPVAAMTHAFFGMYDARIIFLFKHFMTFFVFFWGVFVFSLIAKRHFRSGWMGLLAAVLLVFSPRMFGESFYNPKDIPHLAFFIFAIFTLVRFLEKKSWKWMCIHALVCALAVGVRLTSMIIPFLTLFFLGLHTWRARPELRPQYTGKGAVFFLTWIVLTIGVWPFLWENPIGNFREAYQMMTSYAPEGFYMGKKISTLPWHYVPVWIFITAPILYSLLFLAGVATVAARARRPIDFLVNRSNEAIFTLWFFLPILAVYISGSGIYDGWRHLYFVYPGFLLIALIGVRSLVRILHTALSGSQRSAWAPRICAAVFLVHALWIGAWIWRNHPVQSTYFSIPARFVQHNFELDYWGLSFRPAFERLLALDPSPVIRIWASSSPAYSTLEILPDDQWRRIMMTEEKDATYALNNYRSAGYDQSYPHEEIDRIMAGGVKILGIYRLR